VNLFMKWHRQDPVSPKEVTRNNAIYAHQDNRNPFIDYPELAEYIWGNKNTLSWNESSLTEEHIFNYFVYPNPASDKVFVHVDTTKNVQYILYSVDKLVIETGVFDNEWSIDVRALSSGVYVLQLFVDGVPSSYKILVTNK
ncbi:MAG: endonuclease, partial [Paludibacteraceae bacterium]|nr:endonuclease [Paludibacteraceae bacterium]